MATNSIIPYSDPQTTMPTTAAINETLAAIPCFLVNNLTKNSEEQCKFIMDNDCLEDEATIDYVYLVYCEFGLEMRGAAISLILFLVIVLFLNLSAVADEFLCPSLLAVAKNLRMSDSLAGVTLLAFGNGCPDIFASLAAASSNRPELIVGELLGAGIFCTSIVAGLIFIHSDFKLACRPVLRDATFYLLAVYLIWLYCWNQEITFYGSLAFIVIYVIYLIVALSGQAIHSRLRGDYPIAATQLENRLKEAEEAEKKQQQQLDEKKDWYKWREESLRRRKLKLEASRGESDTEKKALTRDSQVVYQHSHNHQHNHPREVKKENSSHNNAAQTQQQHSHSPMVEIPLEVQLCSIISPQPPPPQSSCCCCRRSSGAISSIGGDGGHFNEAFMTDNNNSCGNDTKQPQNVVAKVPTTGDVQMLRIDETDSNRGCSSRHEWDEFICKLIPLDCQNWNQMSLTSRVISVLRAPILFVTILTVPVVDKDKRNSNWNRLLNSLHCITIPCAIAFSSKWLPDDDVPLLFGLEMSLKLLLAIIPGVALALLVFRTSSAHEPPSYHATFAYFGFLMSVLWVYCLATEVISLLKTFGILFSLSDKAIGLSVLAWGNSLGDIVANLSLAEAGYPRMALGASIGAPLLNLLLGFGLAFSVYLKPGQVAPIKYSPMVTLLCSTLATILCSLMLCTLAPANRSKRYFGFLLIGCYLVYFLLAVLIECGVLAF